MTYNILHIMNGQFERIDVPRLRRDVESHRIIYDKYADIMHNLDKYNLRGYTEDVRVARQNMSYLDRKIREIKED